MGACLDKGGGKDHEQSTGEPYKAKTDKADNKGDQFHGVVDAEPEPPKEDLLSNPPDLAKTTNSSIPEMASVSAIDSKEMRAARYFENRDFVILVDASGSMSTGDVNSKTGKRCRRWDNVGNAVQALVVQVMEWDEDGIDLYLFATGFEKFKNVDSPSKVLSIFNDHRPKGTKDLAAVLDAAFEDHFDKESRRRPTTILVITDGEPNSEEDVIKSICSASDRCESQVELSVTFVQVGDDNSATKFLRKLDDEMPCKHDIVDTMKDDCLQSGGLSFEEIVHLSVTD